MYSNLNHLHFLMGGCRPPRFFGYYQLILLAAVYLETLLPVFFFMYGRYIIQMVFFHSPFSDGGYRFTRKCNYTV